MGVRSGRSVGPPPGDAVAQVPEGRVTTVEPAGGAKVDAGGLAVNAVNVTVDPPALE